MAEKLTPRKQQALEMRQKIQTVALDLFDRHGFENVSVEMIAQAVEVLCTCLKLAALEKLGI